MASHFAMRCLPPLSRVPSTNSGPKAQFLCREAKPIKLSIRTKALSMTMMKNIRMKAMNNNGSELGNEDDCLPYIYVSETSLSCLPVWKTDNILSNLKPGYFVNFLEENDKEYFVACFPEEDGTISPKYSIYPPSFLAKDYSFTGCSSNGLLHFHFGDDKLSHHALWNPTTCEYKILPDPFVEPHLEFCSESFAMWSDHTFENYKLMRLVYNYFDDEALVSTREYCQIHLYSLKTNSWKQIPVTEFDSFWESIHVCVNGVFYCMASQKGAREDVILAFDFSTETLSSLPLPDYSQNHSESYHIDYSFLDYTGLLSVLKCFYHEVEGQTYIRNYELWVMSDGTWTRESVFFARHIDCTFLFSHDGKLLYFTRCHEQDQIVAFNRATGGLKPLGVKCDHFCYPTMIPFFKSFVRLDGISCIEEKLEKEVNDVTEKEPKMTEA